MARTAFAICILAWVAATTAAQRPSPISGDEAGVGPVPVVPVPPASSPPRSASGASPPSSAASDRPGCTLGSYHAIGDSWFTSGREGCLKYTCQRSGVVSSQPCPRVLAPEGCSVKEGDADALFPACCPQRECDPAGVAVPLPAVVVDQPSATTSTTTSSTSTQAPSSTTTPASA